MRLAGVSIAAAAVLLAGCATGYSMVSPGIVTIGDFDVNAAGGWNRVPDTRVPWARRGTQVWTQNGRSLDRLVLIPGVLDGEAIYRSDDDTEYPPYQAGMGDLELVDLVERTIELAQGANRTKVTAGELRSNRFGAYDGILFDLEAIVHDGPAYRGVAGAFRSEGRLYLVYFLGASPYYYDSRSAAALATIRSARR